MNRRGPAPILHLALGATVFWLLLVGCAPQAKPSAGYEPPVASHETTVSRALQRGIGLQAGMTLAQIRQLVGSNGTQSDSDLYHWTFADGSRLEVQFANGKAVRAYEFEGAAQPNTVLFE
jgi:hypothetical protein